ncbi:hypothetical protein QGX11_gp051 [Pseudomonas phage PPSC2]|uniref:Uncharacterized protein n=1 Tax=Pseudomonas phage PPSC2 TaxID=2041350 RepID=A0A2R2YAL4_9CAUD|nr:hypothetical protein QGX11_gp051 [Pseudomonas phage PPSC2]ATN92814.1 hypothetical protein PPSC2_51 [Pseudomonas phage PPSC2]
MSFVEKGVKVKVLSKDGKAFHNLREGDTVVSTGGGLELSTGNWTIFEEDGGFTQYLLPYHYEVIKEDVVAKVKEVAVASTTEVLPSKVIYGIVNSADDVIASTFDRDYARELKAAMGGKRQGVRIFAFAATKEIR